MDCKEMQQEAVEPVKRLSLHNIIRAAVVWFVGLDTPAKSIPCHPLEPSCRLSHGTRPN